jgi:hypothetical protein
VREGNLDVFDLSRYFPSRRPRFVAVHVETA